MSWRVRHVLTILGVLLVVGVLAALKGAQIVTLIDFGQQAAAEGPPPEAVSVYQARQERWQDTIEAVGTVVSAKGLSVSTEVAGAVSRVRFDSGDRVARGAVLIELDSSVERAQLASALARVDLAERTVARSTLLLAGGAVPQSQFDENVSSLRSLEAEAAALRAQIEKKIIRAPFSGRVGIRRVELGEYLAPGAVVTELEDIDELYVDFPLPQRRLDDVAPGMPVTVSWAGGDERARGRIVAFEPGIDRATRSATLRAGFSREEAGLRPGMFVDVVVHLPEVSTPVVVPATAVVRAPYGDSVFVVGEATERRTPDGEPVRPAHQQFVRVGRQRGDFVEILKGVQAGQQVVTAGAFKLRGDAPVVVREGAGPEPDLSPQPENR